MDKKQLGPMLVKENDEWVISVKWAVYMKTTHGIPIDTLEGFVNDYIETVKNEYRKE